jgi:hypothetical protein
MRQACDYQKLTETLMQVTKKQQSEIASLRAQATLLSARTAANDHKLKRKVIKASISTVVSTP